MPQCKPSMVCRAGWFAVLAMLAMSGDVGPYVERFHTLSSARPLQMCSLFPFCFLAGVPGASFLFIRLLLIASCPFFFFFFLLRNNRWGYS